MENLLSSPNLPTLGSVIGGCRVIRLMGKGGFGAVFLANQERFDRDVAVKIVLATTLFSVITMPLWIRFGTGFVF